jgi:PST family polysaccharide transporter
MSKGRTGLMFSIGIITSIFYVAAIVIGLQWGMIGVVICYAIADFIITPFDYYIPFKLIHLPLMHLVTVTWRPLLCSLIMALFLWSTSEFILLSTGKIIGLTLLVAFGAGIYLLMNWYINRRQLQDFVRIAVKLS